MQTAALEQPRSHSMERRRHHRVRVALLGRYMLADHREYACQTTDMSPGGASLVAPVKGAVGERVVLYLEHVGRIEGEITRHTAQGFTVSIAATVRKRDKLASQLTWLGNRHDLGLPEDRRHERIVPRDRKSTRLNSSHANISYAVFCLKKKKNKNKRIWTNKKKKNKNNKEIKNNNI